MVGFDPTHGSHLSESEQAISGAFSGVVTRAVSQPLDVVKVRFQLQIEPIKKNGGSKYHGILQAFFKILREEKMQALWKGHIPAQGLSVTFGLVQFSSFEMLTKHIGEVFPVVLTEEWRPIYHFVCGGLAGCLASCASQPMDVLRTRLVAQGEPKVYKSLWHGASSMYRGEGVRVFFKGLSPTLLQIVPQSGLQFGFYAFSTHLYDVIFRKEDPNNPLTHHPVSGLESLVCGSLAGIFSKSVVYPFDLLKKRLQVVGFEKARLTFGDIRKYRSLRDCIGTIVKDEGIIGLYKGIAPSLLKAALSVGLTFSVYEQCTRFLEQVHLERDKRK